MNNQNNIFLKQMDKYLSFLSSLTKDEIDRLQSGQSTINFQIMEVNKKHKSKNDTPKLFAENFDPEVIIANMLKFSSREDGEKYLLTKCTCKRDYILLVKKLDLPFEKKDSVDKLRGKIIEATIGFRLRSQAIQG